MIKISSTDLNHKLERERTIVLNDTQHARCNHLHQYGLLELDRFSWVLLPIKMGHIVHLSQRLRHQHRAVTGIALYRATVLVSRMYIKAMLFMS